MDTAQQTVPAPVSLGEAFKYWLKLGFISFGGPAGQISIMHQELVEKRRWISEHRFLHALNYCMLLPGPEATQLAIYIAWLMHGIRGAVVAGVLFFLPGFVLLSLLAGIYLAWGDVPLVQGIFYGIKPAVVGVILNLAVFFAWHTFWPQGSTAEPFAGAFEWFPVIVAIAAFMALWKYQAEIMKVIGVCAPLGLAYTLFV